MSKKGHDILGDMGGEEGSGNINQKKIMLHIQITHFENSAITFYLFAFFSQPNNAHSMKKYIKFNINIMLFWQCKNVSKCIHNFEKNICGNVWGECEKFI